MRVRDLALPLATGKMANEADRLRVARRIGTDRERPGTIPAACEFARSVLFALHLAGSTRQANDEAARHGRPPITSAQHLAEAQFWYESFQNWKSEFFAMGVFIVLTVYLRQRGSPQSKPLPPRPTRPRPEERRRSRRAAGIRRFPLTESKAATTPCGRARRSVEAPRSCAIGPKSPRQDSGGSGCGRRRRWRCRAAAVAFGRGEGSPG